MTRWFDSRLSDDVAIVGGTSAAQSELTTELFDVRGQGLRGFSTAADIYELVLEGEHARSRLMEL